MPSENKNFHCIHSLHSQSLSLGFLYIYPSTFMPGCQPHQAGYKSFSSYQFQFVHSTVRRECMFGLVSEWGRQHACVYEKLLRKKNFSFSFSIYFPRIKSKFNEHFAFPLQTLFLIWLSHRRLAGLGMGNWGLK